MHTHSSIKDSCFQNISINSFISGEQLITSKYIVSYYNQQCKGFFSFQDVQVVSLRMDRVDPDMQGQILFWVLRYLGCYAAYVGSNTSEERRSQLHRGGSQNCRIILFDCILYCIVDFACSIVVTNRKPVLQPSFFK